MSIKQAREFAHMTRQEVEDDFGIPSRSLENWENELREPPEYVKKWLVKELIQSVRFAQIRWEESYVRLGIDEPKKGFSCWINDTKKKEGDLQFAWFIAVDDEGKMNSSVVWKIGQLVEAGWKVYFLE